MIAHVSRERGASREYAEASALGDELATSSWYTYDFPRRGQKSSCCHHQQDAGVLVPQITTRIGGVVFAVAWLCFAYFGVRSADCTRFDACTGDDLFLAMIVGVGMLVPAWILGALVSVMSGGQDRD